MEDWKKEVQELRERRDALAKKVEETLIESGCTYGDARRVLDDLSYRYRKSGNLGNGCLAQRQIRWTRNQKKGVQKR